MSQKVAVILFNLGGPDSKKAIKPFLYNFFMDPAIIGLPKILRWVLALYISLTRSRGEAGSGYAELGYKSPLLDNTRMQALALQKELATNSSEINYKVFVCMRYWHPMSSEVVQQVLDFSPDFVVQLPLYPQFSTTTTGSSLKEWSKEAQKAGLSAEHSFVCCYPADSGFIGASAKNVLQAYKKALKQAQELKTKTPRLLFSAHGLPESLIKKGDPYQWQCEQTAAEIVKTMDMSDLDWEICYQSKVGPAKWIGPSTKEAIIQAGKDQVPVVVYPHAFVSEHIETLVEIETEYRELAESAGVPFFERVQTVSTSPAFIKGLAAMVLTTQAKKTAGKRGPDRLCPNSFTGCYLQGQNSIREVA